MPVLLNPLGFAPLQLTATMMGFDTDDPLISHLLSLNHEVAHHLLCQGGANHTWASLFHTLRSASPLATRQRWGVRSLFSGADTFLSALRHIGQDFCPRHPFPRFPFRGWGRAPFPRFRSGAEPRFPVSGLTKGKPRFPVSGLM